MPKATREEVFAALSSERNYQDALRESAGGTNPGDTNAEHELAAYLLYMKVYLDRAILTSSTDRSPACDARTLESVRKVGALAVAAMEIHGAPRREIMPTNDTLEIHGFGQPTGPV
jgi:hypothetical protein